MSFINEALKRAQEEKNHRYDAYDTILQMDATADLHYDKSRISKTALTVALILCAALMMIVLWRMDFIKSVTGSRAVIKSDPVSAAWQPSPEITRIYLDALNHQRQGDYVIAEALYHQVISLDPRHIYALNNLGVLNMIQKKPDQAIAHFQRAVSLKKDYVHPYYNLACIYAQLNEVQKSLQHLQTAISLKPDFKDWATKDVDLKNIHHTDGFKKLIGN